MNTAIIMDMMFNTEMIVKDMNGGKEDMTENKQFRDCEVLDNVIYVDDTIISEKRLLEVLNENEGFKIKLDYHQRMHEQYKRDSLAVVGENEQLKNMVRHNYVEHKR